MRFFQMPDCQAARVAHGLAQVVARFPGPGGLIVVRRDNTVIDQHPLFVERGKGLTDPVAEEIADERQPRKEAQAGAFAAPFNADGQLRVNFGQAAPDRLIGHDFIPFGIQIDHRFDLGGEEGLLDGLLDCGAFAAAGVADHQDQRGPRNQGVITVFLEDEGVIELVEKGLNRLRHKRVDGLFFEEVGQVLVVLGIEFLGEDMIPGGGGVMGTGRFKTLVPVIEQARVLQQLEFALFRFENPLHPFAQAL